MMASPLVKSKRCDLMAELAHAFGERIPLLARLKQECSAGRAEIGERGGGLRVEVPIEHGDDGLQIEQDDAWPSRRAKQEAKPAFAGGRSHREDHGRIH